LNLSGARRTFVVPVHYLILLALLLTLASGRHAFAHAALVESVPADGAVLTAAPADVMLRFSEPVAPVMLRVLDIDAKPVADGARAQVEDTIIRLPLPAGLAHGTYVVSYRVISVDSHPISGAVVFSIGDSSAADRLSRAHSLGRWMAPTIAAVRALFVAALLIATGTMLALWRLADFAPDIVRRNRRAVVIASGAALCSGAILLVLTGRDFAGTSLAGHVEVEAWQVLLTSSLARSLAVATAGVVLILAALWRLAQGSSRMAAVVGSVIAIASFALTGHAATAAPQQLMRWAVALHALCAAFWLGSLPVLGASLRTDPPKRAMALVQRFSSHAVAAVALLLALGLIIAIVQVEHLDMLWRTAYGRILLAKLAAVALLLAVAIHNKWRTAPRLATDANAVQGLRHAIGVEYILFAIVLALTAALGQVEPPRARVARDTAAVAGGAADFSASVTQGSYRITLSVSPARAGHNALAVDVADSNGQRLAPQEVALELSLPAAGIEPLRRKAARDPAGGFIHHGGELSLAATWHVEVHVLIDDFTRTIAAFDVLIR
jgi:copper transport protein